MCGEVVGEGTFSGQLAWFTHAAVLCGKIPRELQSGGSKDRRLRQLLQECISGGVGECDLVVIVLGKRGIVFKRC